MLITMVICFDTDKELSLAYRKEYDQLGVGRGVKFIRRVNYVTTRSMVKMIENKNITKRKLIWFRNF